jgi:hypothetical protein
VFHYNEYVNFGLLIIFIAGFLWAIKYLCHEVEWLIWRAKHVFIWNPQWRRGEKLLRGARLIGPAWVINTQAGISGVCRYERFDFLLRRKVADLIQTEQLMEIIRVLVPETFTFAEDLSRMMPIHTGDKAAGETLMTRLVQKWAGVRKEDIPDKLWDKIIKALVVRDPRLHVPFSGGSVQAEKQAGYQHDRPTSIDEAYQELRIGHLGL